MPCARSARSSSGRLYGGWRGLYGEERTSATAVTPACRSRRRNVSQSWLEWPTLTRRGPGAEAFSICFWTSGYSIIGGIIPHPDEGLPHGNDSPRLDTDGEVV